MFFGLPMTTKIKDNKVYYRLLVHNQETAVILSQLKLFSSKRLIRRLGKLDIGLFDKIVNEVVNLIKKTPSY